MATSPRWNKRRGTWQVQYWKGKWRRKTVSRAPETWQPGDPEPKMPPQAHAEYLRLCEVEKLAREGVDSELPVSLRDFLEAHIQTYRNPRTRETAEPIVRGFLEWCEARKITRYKQVTRTVCKAWVAHLAETLALSTVATRMGYVAAAWGRQVKAEEIDKSPWKTVEADGEDRTKPRGAWTQDQFAQLKAACEGEDHEWLRDILIIGVNTGLRVRALIGIKWEQWIKPETKEDRHGYIDVPIRLDKVKAGYRVPVSRELHEVLSRREKQRRSAFIVTGKAGRPIGHRNHLGKSIIRACERAGLPRPQSPNHHMRRTFGRWAVKGYLTGKPVPLYTVSRWLGHRDPKTTLRYLDIEDRESAAFMVPDFEEPVIPPSADSATHHPATSPSPGTGDSGGGARSDDSSPDGNAAAGSSR